MTGGRLKFIEARPKSHLMDIRQTGVLVVAIPIAFLIASVVTWAACRWWFGRKLLAAANRLQKSEKGRLFSQQQTAQARQQIGLLKAEIESHQQTAAEIQATRRRAAQAEEALQALERAPAATEGAVMLPLVAAHGFADTQVLPE
jgi:C4-dicarboxylate-specific signal transduction histidine kinase